ncbi:Plus3-like superfamily [Arabidopsis thaliana x Arabidopsis arenosa]|uniref:Plus3-like superfamily n=1 Tax=Arabidopsis thaliana x Arabidopsis arenosa TaxID=1240361 RepID=A0A8T1XM90_9BRAS|nr:Plus3-like superfamily [Arabidopsis thaliana x Arabidopsis arenosa]
MKFASVDAITELVWSPGNGLSLRCADISFTGKAKVVSPNFFDIGLTNMSIHSNSKSIEHQEDVELRSRDQVNQERIGGSVEDMKPEMVEDKVETNDDIKNEVAGTSKRSSDSPKAMEGETRDLLVNEQLRMESAGSQEGPTNRGDKDEGDKANNRIDRLESMDENNLATLAVVACEGKGEYFPEDEAGPSGSYRRHAKAKGKEKALSDGYFDGDDEDDKSFGSVESCNSAGLLSRGKKRPGFEQQLIFGSKRLKTLNQECLGSTSKLKQDSSFMNWISNMTKGIWKGNEEDDSPFVALTTTSDANGHGQVNAIVDQQQLSPCCVKEISGCRNTGFQSFFQSIYCPKKRSQDAVEMDFPNDANATSLQELPWIPEQCDIAKGDGLSSTGNDIGPVAEPNISSGKVGFNQTNETLSSENKREDKEPNISLMSLSKSKPNEEPKICGEAGGKVSPCLTNRNYGLQSLWISRFSSKSSFLQKKASEMAKDANASASDAAKTRDSQKMLVNNNVVIPSISLVDGLDKPYTVLPIVSSMRIESSEAMASLFARRLEAMKHIMPAGSLAENAEEEQKNLICFYCGKKGHCLQDCLEVTDIELRDLVQNISARNGREEASSLCIRCFQLSHWAATCPNAPLYSSGAEDRAMKHTLASTSGMKLHVSGSTDVPKAVFDAIQVLRLSRTDVLKWINTKKSVSGLEGFFLRLRLGKWEEGLGGTGYYVARIDGNTEGQSSRRHSEKSSISVKVKGVTCVVESQFISNQDFLEEELKAWWRSVGKSAERSGCEGIPSAEELSRKIQQRKMLGF